MPLSAWIGVALAVAAFAYVLYPLLAYRRAPGSPRPAAATSTSREVSDDEIEAAIRSYRAREPSGVTCASCGARPEADALFCSSCGRRLVAADPS